MNFTEKQSMGQLWWVLLPTTISIVMMFTFWLGEDNPAEKQELLTGLLVVIGVEALVVALFFSMKLRLKVTPNGVSFSFKPFMREKSYVWSDIEKIWVRKYKPLKEYGGWGFKGGWGRKAGRAYNVWGDKGLQIELKNGKRVLIGTQKANELEVFLKRLKEKHQILQIAPAELNT